MPSQNSAIMTSGNLRPRITQNWRSVIVVHQPIPSLLGQQSGSYQWNLDTSSIQNLNSQNYLSLLVTPEDTQTNKPESNQQPTILTNNISPAIVIEDKLLAVIFPFEIEEPTTTPWFSGVALKKKLITTMYTDAKADGHLIKLILDSGSAGSIITRQLMEQLNCQVDHTSSTKIITTDRATKTPIGEINNFPFKINGLITLIKVLVMEATQYQALVGNNWLFKTNAVFD
ncbi:hypothetical protein G9A89_008345 [Geosiphon pyriformis]|nr:hypothetical protein G9A89_008345 [Geosiphon pyriformis]